MIVHRTLLVALAITAACSGQRTVAPAPVAHEHEVVMLDGERITAADMVLIDTAAILHVSVITGDKARERFGLGTVSVVDITTKPERRFSGSGHVDSHRTASDEPLVLLDGREVSTAVLNVLNPQRIEKIDVMKGESAEKQYGERARSGVVLITTKALRL